MVIRLYNTLTKKKEIFKPISKGKVGIYSCGPTVYSYQHIGNMRTYVFADLLKRMFLFEGYKVNQIINVTDVGHLTSDSDSGDDKIEKAAKKEKKTAKQIADYYFSIFLEDLEKLNILPPNKWPKATDHIKEQINLIKKLEKKGFTYKTSDGIYFNSSKFKNYGKLANLKIENLEEGKRVATREKKNKTDFALWKFSEEKRQQEWDSPWGVGFPGWHIECSAMSMKYLGEHFDIHTGGQDHIHIHHTNEIAQSEAATGKKFVNYWLHGAFLRFGGKKVSKSKGGLYTISELEEKGFLPIHFRYLCLLTHYHKPLDFTLDNLESAKNAYRNLVRKVSSLRENSEKGKDLSSKYEKLFKSSIEDDLNIPSALGVLWKALEDKGFLPDKKLKLLEKFDEVLGLGIKNMKASKIPSEIKSLIKERDKARKDKDWKKSDELRDEIIKKGYKIEDTPDGTVVR